MTVPHAAARTAIVEAGRRLARTGLVLGSSGNISVRAGEEILVTPTGVHLDALEPGMLAVLDLAGNQQSGPLAPSSEVSLHMALYREAGAGAVVHTHAPMATAVACVVDELPVIHYEMLLLGGAVRVAPFAAFGTPELAAAALAALEGRSAALLASHGTVAMGPDLDAAMRATELLEWSAALYLRAASVGTPKVLTPAQVDATIASAQIHGYGSARAAHAGATKQGGRHDD